MVIDKRVRAIHVAALTLLVAAAVVFTHLPVLDAQAMCFDDEEAVVRNQLVQNPSFYSGIRSRFFYVLTHKRIQK